MDIILLKNFVRKLIVDIFRKQKQPILYYTPYVIADIAKQSLKEKLANTTEKDAHDVLKELEKEGKCILELKNRGYFMALMHGYNRSYQAECCPYRFDIKDWLSESEYTNILNPPFETSK